MSEILELGAREAGERIREGELAAQECFAAWVGAAANDDLNAYLWRAGEDGERATHPPLAVKDIFCTAGVPTTAGSRILEGYRPPYTSTAVRKLLEAGAPVLGKTNMDEFAMGSSNENSGYGPVLNPWDRERVPGGSSGGSAAVVAGGLAPWAIGTDTGGSIRQPAAFCGIVGLKPTYGAGVRYGMRAGGDGDLIEMYETTRSEGFGTEVKRRIMLGTYALSSGYYEAYYGQAQKVRTRIAEDFSGAFSSVDFVVTPTAPSVAFKLGEKTDDPLAMYLNDFFTVPMSLAGIPAISIPAGLAAPEGGGPELPVGLQIAGPAFSESGLLDAAHAVEGAIGTLLPERSG